MDKPISAGDSPQMVELEPGKTYAWCACGKSKGQPWCDGAHQGSSMNPNVFQCEEKKTAAICLCKKTKNPPYCDGSHNN